MKNLNLETIDSREVAKQTGERHADVIRKIETMIKYMGQNAILRSDDYFIKSSYKSGTGKNYTCYLLTRSGCEMYVNKLSGKKGTLFTAFYVQRFHQMEYQIANASKDSYMIDDPVKRAERWIEEEKERKQLAEQNESMRPKAIFADAVAVSKTSILIGELAKLLKQNGIDIGAKRLFTWLRDKGYLIKRRGNDWNTPTQRSMDLGLFKVKETTINHSSGNVTISKTTKVTGRGQIYFINKFKNVMGLDF